LLIAAQPDGGTGYDRPDRVRGQRRVRGSRLQEQAAARAARTAPPQVAGQHFADIGGQGQPLVPVGLAADQDLAGPPVHVADLQHGHLARAQSQPGQQDQDRIVTPASGGAAVTATQQAPDLALPDRRGQGRAAPAGHVRHRARQVS